MNFEREPGSMVDADVVDSVARRMRTGKIIRFAVHTAKVPMVFGIGGLAYEVAVQEARPGYTVFYGGIALAGTAFAAVASKIGDRLGDINDSKLTAVFAQAATRPEAPDQQQWPPPQV